jgi:hypothetical protein
VCKATAANREGHFGARFKLSYADTRPRGPQSDPALRSYFFFFDFPQLVPITGE